MMWHVQAHILDVEMEISALIQIGLLSLKIDRP